MGQGGVEGNGVAPMDSLSSPSTELMPDGKYAEAEGEERSNALAHKQQLQQVADDVQESAFNVVYHNLLRDIGLAPDSLAEGSAEIFHEKMDRHREIAHAPYIFTKQRVTRLEKRVRAALEERLITEAMQGVTLNPARTTSTDGELAECKADVEDRIVGYGAAKPVVPSTEPVQEADPNSEFPPTSEQSLQRSVIRMALEDDPSLIDEPWLQEFPKGNLWRDFEAMRRAADRAWPHGREKLAREAALLRGTKVENLQSRCAAEGNRAAQAAKG